VRVFQAFVASGLLLAGLLLASPSGRAEDPVVEDCKSCAPNGSCDSLHGCSDCTPTLECCVRCTNGSSANKKCGSGPPGLQCVRTFVHDCGEREYGTCTPPSPCVYPGVTSGACGGRWICSYYAGCGWPE
jgi:hypothetical protein